MGPVQAASDGDISETSFNLSTNQTTPVDVTNFNFNNTDVRSFEGLCSVYISSDDELYETFKILGIQKASGWDMSVEKVGDDSQVIFSITTLGQIQYTTPNYSNFNSGLLKFRAITTSI